MTDMKDMTVQQLEEAAKAEAAEAKKAADEAAQASTKAAAQASTKAAAEKAAKKAVEAAERASRLIELMEERKAEEAVKHALEVAEKAAAPVVDPEKEAMEKERTRALEPVTINLFKDNERYKDDVAVFVNNNRVLIQRGVDVTVPRYIAEVLAASQKQDNLTDAMMTRLEEEYERKTEEKTKPYAG